ncbi:MAG: hypothetical protein NZR01_01025 [Bryobacteraceae bacterium]|nr:hypothetical protein [Bryobacteraceae bacterium]
MPKVFSVLFGALFAVLCSWALGRMLLKRARLALAREEAHVLAFVCGAPLLSTLVFLLCIVRAVYDAVFLAAGLLILAAAWRDGAFRSHAAERLPALPRLWRWLFPLIYAVYAAVAVLAAMAPEISPDGSGYHLGFVARYYRGHGLARIDTNMYAALSQGIEMLFLWAFAFGRHSAAALVHCTFLLATPLLMLRFGQRFGAPVAGAAAGLFFLCAPVVLVDGTSAYIDAAAACIVFAIVYLTERKAPPWLLGVMGGFAYAVKYTAAVALLYPLLRLAWKKQWRALVPLCAAAALVAAPWPLRNWIFYGNPAAPLMNRVWPNQFVHASFEQDYVESMRRYPEIESWPQVAMELTVRGRLLAGFWGPLFLLAPLGLLALRSGLGRRMLLAAAIAGSTYFSNIGARFLMPAAPFVSYAMALALPSPVLAVLAAAHAVAGFPDMPEKYMESPGWRLSKIPWRAALRLEREEAWLAEQSAGYRAARMVEWLTPPGALVFSFSGIPESYTSREIAVCFQSGRGERLLDLLQVAMFTEMRPMAERVFRFPRQPLTALRVVQTNTPAPGSDRAKDLWSVFEVRVSQGGRELARDASWRVWAEPNPWGAGLAFDGSPVTRWRSWERIRAGMFLQAEFGGEREADEVRLVMSEDQHGVRLRLEGRTPAGWRTLGEDPPVRGIAFPLTLRRLAMRELGRGGVTHLLVHENDYAWADLSKHARAWGIREIGAVDGYHLFQLE